MRYSLALSLVFAGCFSASGKLCTPGAQQACACASGGQGIQVCAQDGSSLGSCTSCPFPEIDFATPGDGGDSCGDGVTDGNETDVDCGGDSCPACDNGESCLGAADCVSGACTNGTCQSLISCAPPLANCDGNAQSGCNVDTNSDAKNCGQCGTVCPMGRACSGGKCISVKCPNALTFATPVGYPSNVNGIMLGIHAVDLNGDGKPDLATVTDQSDVVSVYLNKGGGTFGVASDYATAKQPLGLAVADFNGDGKPDLATSNAEDANASLFFNQGNGLFGGRSDFGTIMQPESIAAGDLNGDGKPDLVVGAYAGNQASVFLNSGGGMFGASSGYPTAIAPEDVTIGDLNGDGKPDIVTAGEGFVSVLLNQGNGVFAQHVDYQLPGPGTTTPRIADLNGDGKPDLVVANSRGGGSTTVSVLLNQGAGVLGGRTDYDVGVAVVNGVAVGDLDGDGRPDLAAVGQPMLSILVNKGGGLFGPKVVIDNANGYASVTIADLNADGKPDIALANIGIIVFLNTCH